MKKLLTEWREYLLTEQASPVKAFMEEYHSNSGTQDGMGFIYWQMSDTCYVKTLAYEDKGNPGGIYFEAIRTLKFETPSSDPEVDCLRKGYASQVMNKIAALADTHGVVMRSTVKPFGPKNVKKGDLMKWYSSVGFVKAGKGIIREPK